MDKQQLKMRRLRVSGFKALDGFDLRLPKDLSILIGANGSGKSSLLQCLAFIPYFTKGSPKAFFYDRHWTASDVRSRVEKGRHNIRIDIAFEGEGDVIYWGFTWNSTKENLTNEMVTRRKRGDAKQELLLAYGEKFSILGNTPKFNAPEGIKPMGSFLSVIDFSSLSKEYSGTLEAVKRWGEGIFSLELLSPVAMRKGARGSQTDIGPRGERLGGFLASLTPAQKHRLVSRLSQFYPLRQLDAVKKTAGWVDLRIAEAYRGLGTINANHMSDGFMRLLGLASIPEFGTQASLVLLDEIEDGIEPHILSDFVHLIAEESSAQLLLTSHSPLLVNSFDSSEISFIARDDDGRSIAARFDDLPQLREGLEFYGPGELWSHSTLNDITRWVKEFNSNVIKRDVAGADPKKGTRPESFLHDILDITE